MPCKPATVTKALAFAFALQLICLTVLLALCTPASAEAADWPDCKFQCRAGDVTLERIYIGDQIGNALSQCAPGSQVNARLWITIRNNANSPRHAVILLADIYVNGALRNSLYDEGLCVLDSIPAKATSSYPIYSLSWNCGQEVRLSRVILSWETESKASCENADRKCSNRNTKCYGGPTTEIIAERPIVPYFVSNSPQCCCGEISFYDSTTGGQGPYTYQWSFGDGATSSDKNPTHAYASPGTYIVTLRATDSRGASGEFSFNVVLNPKPIANAGQNKSTVPGMSITIGGSPTASGGLGPYTYSWIPNETLEGDSTSNPTATPTRTTGYTVEVTDARGCTDTASTIVFISNISLKKFPSSANAIVGDLVNYTYVVRNTGDVQISGISFTDDKLGDISSLNRTTLLPGETASASASYIVTETDHPGPILNTATVRGTDALGRALVAYASSSVRISALPLTPIISCVRDEGNGTYTAFFGYINGGTDSIYLPIGRTNGFSGQELYRGQPTTFLPGQNPFAFSSSFAEGELVWSLVGRQAAASTGSSPCPAQSCLIDGPAAVCREASKIYRSSVRETPPYSFSYSWRMDGNLIGSQRTVEIVGDDYDLGDHILELTVLSSIDNRMVSSAKCGLHVKIVPVPNADIELVRVV